MTFLAVLFPLAVYCFPLAVYCLILGFLNRGRHPVLMRGTWDLVGLLFAASGFLLFGGPDILQTLYEHQRSAYALKQSSFLSRFGDDAWLVWLSLWGLYFVGVVGTVVYLFRRRLGMTTVYNVDPALFEAVLSQVLDRQFGSWSRVGNQVLVEERAMVAAGPDRHSQALPPLPRDHTSCPNSSPGCAVLLELDPFPAMRHVTLYWRAGMAEVRRAIEVELVTQLAQVRSGYNPAGGWFLSLAACLFCGTFFSLVLLMATVILRIAR